MIGKWVGVCKGILIHMQTNIVHIRSLALVVLPLQCVVACGGTVANNSTSNGGPSGGGSYGSPGGAGSVGGVTSDSTLAVLDKSILSTGDSNAISSGGYWWTYTDHNAAGSPYHATISQVTSAVVGLLPTADSDPSHGNVLQVSGSIPPALPWALVSVQDPSTIDRYWQAVYPDSAIPDYPAAGIGFGFRHFNAPFDGTGGGKWIGIAFDMKVSVNMQTVWVSMPTPGTDLPDPNYADNFANQCQYYTATNTPAIGGESCFAYYRKGVFASGSGSGNAYNTLANPGSWKRYCVLYSEVSPPNWANAATLSMLPRFDPTQLLKVSWDMYQPSEQGRAGVGASFDVSLDNVSLITTVQAKDPLNNCDPGRIGLPPGSGDAG